jgi:glyoxylase I family protein
MTMPEISALLHVSLLVSDLDRARRFYEGLFGLLPSSARPDMSFSGVWYQIGDTQIHLMCLPDPAQGISRPEHGGRDYHVAFAVRDLEVCKQRFEHLGLTYTMSRSGRDAMFVRDPDGNALELVQAD